MNLEYIKVLLDIVSSCRKDKYVVLGSAATLSYTSRIGYSRQMNDLDLIVDVSQVTKMKDKLIKEGYDQSSFIDKRMPFFKNLTNYSKSTYLRFTKDNINVEILRTKFIESDSYMKFNLYPNIYVQIPKYSLVTTKLGEAEFTALDVNLHWAIKYLLSKSLGKIMSYKHEQRVMDISNLRKLIDIEKAKKILNNCRLGYKFISIKIPNFLLK